jgi:hypothetical protein
MAEGHAQRHQVEFGGSPVSTEFDGRLGFDLIDRIPVFTLSHDFSEHAARQIRYALVSTWGPERPFYQRYEWVVIDIRMVTGWAEGAGRFLTQLRDRLRQIGGRFRAPDGAELWGGDLVLVAYDTSMLPGEFLTGDTVAAAVALVNERRAAARAAVLQR